MTAHNARTKETQRDRRRKRVRARIFGTAERPRLNVTRSLSHLYLQLIDDTAGKTICSVHSKNDAKEAAAAEGQSRNMAIAFALGKTLAEKAKTAGVTRAVFDRAGYAYHGRVKAAAEGAREGGLIF